MIHRRAAWRWEKRYVPWATWLCHVAARFACLLACEGGWRCFLLQDVRCLIFLLPSVSSLIPVPVRDARARDIPEAFSSETY